MMESDSVHITSLTQEQDIADLERMGGMLTQLETMTYNMRTTAEAIGREFAAQNATLADTSAKMDRTEELLEAAIKLRRKL